MNVVVTRVLSTLESANINRNVTTEFQWEIHNLRALLQASLFTSATRGIASPRFKIEGAGDHATLWIYGNVERRVEAYQVAIASDVLIEGEVTVQCGGKQLETKVQSPSNCSSIKPDTLCSIKPDTELHAAMESSAKLCVKLRVKPLPRNQAVDTVLGEGCRHASSCPSISEVFRDALSSDDLQALADVEVISIDGETFRAHRQMLALRSPVFRAAFYCGMRESQTMRTNVQASGAAVKGLLHCIYTDEIQSEESKSCAGELLDLGMQYQVPRLVVLANKHLLETLSIDNVAERLRLGIQYDASRLQEAAIRVVKQNLSAVMATEGWSLISSDAKVMKRLLATDSMHCSSEARARKRLRTS